MRDLGAPRAVRNACKLDGVWKRYTASYLQHLALQTEPVALLLPIAISKPCCLLCFEADPLTSHRLFVPKELVRRAAGRLNLENIKIPARVARPVLQLA